MNHRAFDHVLLGCGLSGSLCLIELLRTHSLPQRIAVFEANPHQLFRGKAYAADVSVQVLNVHADQMSLYWDDPLHFVRWLADQNLPYGPHDFVPRSLFGAYLEHSVKQALNQATGHTVSFFFEKVQGIAPEGDGFTLHSDSGSRSARQVWIATGNFSPADIASDPEVQKHPNYLGDPWRGAGLKYLPSSDSVLMVGTGLTMVDQVLALRAQGHTGQIYALSRRGMYPMAHQPSPPHAWFKPYADQEIDPLNLLRLVRREVRNAQKIGIPWTSVLNDLRAFTPGIWAHWRTEDRIAFMRHIRPYWEVHRHRLPTSSLDALADLEAAGTLVRYAGRITEIGFAPRGFRISFSQRPDGRPQEVSADWILNCTGPQSFGRKLGEPWVQDALNSGILTSDALSLGIEPRAAFRRRVHVLGPPRKGTDWESTAMREIRAQVQSEVGRLI
jgi:uncharacterized NAD(P)/FAD-binding protein YdhS